MENLISYIVGDATTFEPRVIVGLIVFVLLLDGICSLVGNMVKGVKR